MRKATEVTSQLDGALSKEQEALMKWDASMKNAQTSLGIFLGSFVAEPLEAFADMLDVLSGRQEAWWQTAIRTNREAAEAAHDGAERHREAYSKVIDGIDKTIWTTKQWMDQSKAAYGEVADDAWRMQDQVSEGMGNIVIAGRQLEDETEAMENAYKNLADESDYLALVMRFLKGDVDEAALAQDNLTWSSSLVESQYNSLNSELGILQVELNSTQSAMESLDAASRVLSLEQAELRLEQMKLNDAYKDGKITEKAYEKASEKLNDQMRGLQIQMQENRIEGMLLNDTFGDQSENVSELENLINILLDADDDLEQATADVNKQFEAFEAELEGLIEDLGLSEIQAGFLRKALDELKSKSITVTTDVASNVAGGEPTISGEAGGVATFTVPFVSRHKELAGLAPGVATSADRITNIEITVDVDKLSADPTEIAALVQQLAEELYKEMQKRGGVP